MQNEWDQYKISSEPSINEWDQYKLQEKPKSKGLRGIGKDIWEGAKEAPGLLLEGLMALPGEAAGAFGQIATNPKRAGQNVLAGFGEYGQDLMNFPSTAVNYLADKDLASSAFAQSIPRREERDYRDLVGLEGQEAGDILLSSAAPMLGVAPAGELGALGKIGRTAARSGAMGAQSAIAGENPVAGALTVPAAELGIRAAGRAFKSAKEVPTAVASGFGTASPERLAENLRVTEGTNTGLGRVLESPSLIALQENMLPHQIGSGAEKATAKAVEGLQSKANDIVGKLSENVPDADPNFVIKDALQKAYEKQREAKENLYGNVDKIAQKEGLDLNLSNFQNRAASISQNINDSVLSINPEIKALYNKTRDIAQNEGKPTLRDAKMLKGYLYNLAEEYRKSPNPTDRQVAGEISTLSKAIDADIAEAVKATGSEELSSALKKADDFYKENYSGWLDKEAYKIRRDNPETLIHSVLGSGKKLDKFSRIEKIQKLLPEEDKGLLAYGYLSKAKDNLGQINPNELSKLIGSLGERQRKALFPGKAGLKEVEDYAALAKLNQEPLNRLFNPKTGQRAQSYLPLGEISYAASGLGAGSLIPAATVAGAGLSANMLTRAMASEAFRDKTVAKKLGKENKIFNEKSSKQQETEKTLTLTVPYGSKAAQEKKREKK